MAIIICSECGKEISDKASICVNCCAPLSVESKVIVQGYTQQFLFAPKVKVFWNDKLVGEVARGQQFAFDIDFDGVVTCKCNMRSATMPVQKDKINKIKISWDRISGKMILEKVDVFSS